MRQRRHAVLERTGLVGRFAMLVLSIVVVSGLAGITVWAQLDAGAEARTVHAQDRVQQEKVLAGLTGQYLEFTFLAVNTAAQGNDWSLAPGNPRDVARLRAYATTSPLTGYGAALVDLAGHPLSSYPSVSALPPVSDPGYAPLRLAMLGGKPGLSSVMHVAGAPLVAFAVPVMRAGKPVAIFAAFADLRTWALEGYVQKLDLGPGAVTYTVDGQGVVTAAVDTTLIGKKLALGPVVQAALAGRSGMTTARTNDARGRHATDVVTYNPVGVGGWAAFAVQPQQDYLGSLSSRNNRAILGLVAMLAFVVILLVVLNHRRQRLAQQLAEQRLHDPLTGLGQRVIFELKLEAALARQRRSGGPVAVIYCDLDDFKGVNDRLGHNAGDRLLVEVAGRLRSAARVDDGVVRLGGDEFALVVEGVHADELERLVTRLRAVVAQDVTVAGEVVTPGLSVGAAVMLEPGPGEQLVHAADLAMYHAKSTGAGAHVTVVSADDVVLPPAGLNRTGSLPAQRSDAGRQPSRAHGQGGS